MPWLVELVQASESSLEVLPVQCLCEFLLHDVTEEADDADEAKAEKAHKEKVFKLEDFYVCLCVDLP